MILQLERVAKLFGGFAALRDATADFETGKLYLITGENGAGKSTLLRMIAGLMAPSRGRIVWGGAVVSPQPSALSSQHSFSSERLAVGYMAHATMLYDELSGMENLRYFAKLYGIGDGHRRDGERSHGGDESCETAMRTVGLDPELKRAVGQYSQGMRQRLALARAMVHSPTLLLLDEPFSNLDVGSARHMVEVLAGQRDRGMCVIVVTHQAALVAEAADCHLHISGGVMRQV